jgi:hypothetical protein
MEVYQSILFILLSNSKNGIENNIFVDRLTVNIQVVFLDTELVHDNIGS